MTPAETQRAVNLLVLDTLTKAGWTLTRDNESGGALVLEGDGLSIVGGFHAYPIKPTKESLAEVVVEDAFSKVLIPALPAGTGKIPLGWVIEHEGGDWYDGDGGWIDMLNDGARVYTDDEKFDLATLDLDPDRQDSGWFPVYGHEVDGCLTTEACPGVDTCQDCLDVRKSAGEVLADDPIDGHKSDEINEQSEEDS